MYIYTNVFLHTLNNIHVHVLLKMAINIKVSNP